MVTIKEAGPNSPIQLTEVLQVERNGFARFLQENNEAFDRHAFLTYELRDEEAGWENSPTLNGIIERGLELAYIAYPHFKKNKKQERKTVNNLTRTIHRIIFEPSGQQEKNLISLGFASLSRFNGPNTKALAESIGEDIEEFKTSYEQAVRPLKSQLNESKTEVFGRFRDFLLSDPSHIMVFRSFLSDKDYARKREEIRPFLVNLAQIKERGSKEDRESPFSEAAKKWIGELKERPTPSIIDEFIASIKSPAILEWLEFAAHMPIKSPRTIEERDKDLIQDIANFLKSRPDVSTWTTELREALSSFVASKYFSSIGSIQKDLGQYRKPLSLKSISQRMDPELEGEIEKVTVKMPDGKTQGQRDKKETADVQEEKYSIGTVSKEIGKANIVRHVQEEELKNILEKAAANLDPADPRMIADLKTIIADLQKSPYGLGTKKLTAMSLGIGNRTIPLRSINPGKRMGLVLSHPESTRIRVVYVIYRNGEDPVIGIEGIYKHEDYDRKFGS